MDGFDLYQVSSLGRVRNRVTGRVLNPKPNEYGYFRVWLRRGTRDAPMLVHRLVAIAFIPKVPDMDVINHLDGVKTNNAPGNLEWTTLAENTRHAFRTGLTPRRVIEPGEKCPSAKLNEAQVRQIKRRLHNGEGLKAIAHDYGVASGTIGFIKTGKTWAGVVMEGT